MTQIIVTGDVIPKKILDLKNHYEIEIIHITSDSNEDEIIKHILTADYYFLGGLERLDKKILQDAKNLKAISFVGKGVASFIDLDVAKEKNIDVYTTPSINTSSVSEFAIMSALNLMRGSITNTIDIIEGKNKKYSHGRTLSNCKAGIVGLGEIGTQLALTLKHGFNCKVSYNSRTKKPNLENLLDLNFLPLQKLFEECEIVFLCCDYNTTSHKIFDQKINLKYSKCKFLVNTSDARLICPAFLLESLNNQNITSCSLDGYYIEPIPFVNDDPYGLLSLGTNKLIVTQHIAASTLDVWGKMLDVAANNLIEKLKKCT